MVKHTQTIRRLLPTNCLSVFDPFEGLVLEGLKAFPSDGTSVMTGSNGGVAAKLREYKNLKILLFVYCLSHRLALACAHSSNRVTFLKDFKLTFIQLWALKKLTKEVNVYLKTTYLKTTHKIHNWDGDITWQQG